MATTFEEQVELLLSRSVAAGKSRGAPSPDVEISAIFETVAMNLLFRPRTALYIALIARNKLQQIVQSELDLLDTLKQDIQDLGNPSYLVRDVTLLQRVRTNLLQLEGLDKVSVTNSAFIRFSKTVDDFLKEQLAKNVVDYENGKMIRPSAEAEAVLPSTFAALKALHGQMLERLYSLAVGVDNFITAPISTLLGTTTVSRARNDLDDLLDLIQRTDGSAQYARDIVIRLIANRAAVRAVGSIPDPFSPVAGGDSPVQARSLTTTSHLALSGAGPFALVGSQVRVGETSALVPCADVDLAAKAVHVGASATFSAPGASSLFVTVGSENYTLAVDGSTAQEVASSINAAGTPVRASSFYNRLVLYCDSDFVLTQDKDVVDIHGEPKVPRTSAHSYLGLSLGGSVRTLEAVVLCDALKSAFAGHDIRVISGGRIRWELASTDCSFPAEWGFTVETGGSNSLELVGTGELPSIGDRITCGSISARVIGVLSNSILIDQVWPTIESPVVVTSVVAECYQELIQRLEAFLARWAETPFVQDLAQLDTAIAPLGASTTPAHRTRAAAEIDKLRKNLVDLLEVLTDPATILPSAKLAESDVLRGILSTLEERNLDRAADMLLKCQIQEVLTLTPDQASYGSNLLGAASELSRADVLREVP